MKCMFSLMKCMLFYSLLLLGLCACQPTGSDSVVLNIWLDSNEKEMRFFQSLRRRFEQSHPHIRLRLRFISFADLKPRYRGAAREGSEPDLVYLMSDWVGELAEDQLLLALPSPSGQALAFSQESMRYQNQNFAQPFVFQVAALIRNIQQVPQAPVQIAASPPVGVSLYPLMYDNRNFYFHAAWLHAFGGRLFDAQGRFSLTRAPLLQSLRFALDLEKSGWISAHSSASASLNLFSAGKVAMIISGPWALSFPQANGISYAVSPWPRIAAPHPPRPFVGVKGFGINPRSRYPQAARAWLAYLSSYSVQQRVLQELDNLPVQADVYTQNQIPAEKQQFYTQALQGVPMPNHPLMKDVWQEMNWVLNQAFEQPLSLERWVDQALQRLKQKAEQYESVRT